ncbi:TetR/AcrR family transcriptional regulator [Profundibacter sp.]
MAGKVQERQAKLRERLIDAGEAQVIAGGVSSMKARDLAREAGCALGAIYNVFDDMQALLMAINMRTFRRMGVAVAASQVGAEGLDPNKRMIRMATAYLHFAAENTNLWRALFDLEMSVDSRVPDWYLQELGRLFAYIAAPLAELFPEKDEDELDLMTRAMFSAVHGIVLLGLEKRISGVPIERVEEMLKQLLCQIGNK